MRKILLVIMFMSFICKAEAPDRIAPIASEDKNAANEILKERILRDYPELQNEGLSDWDKVRLLRTWTWGQIDTGWYPYLYNLGGLTAAEIIEKFDSDRGGAWCGGCGDTLVKIYELFGYEAYRMGIRMIPPAKEWASHVLVLVKIKDHHGKDIFSPQDADFNCTIADSNGYPIDYVVFLEKLREHKLEEVQMLSFDMPTRKISTTIAHPELTANMTFEEIAHSQWSVDMSNYTIEDGKPGGWVKISSPRSIKLYEERMYYFKEILMANNLTPDSIYTYLYAEQVFYGPKDYLAKMQAAADLPPLKPLNYPPYKVWFSVSGYRELTWKWSNLSNDGVRASITVEKGGTKKFSLWMGSSRVPIDSIAFSSVPLYIPRGKEPPENSKNIIILEVEDYNNAIERSGAYWLTLEKQSKRHNGRGFMTTLPRFKHFTKKDIGISPELVYEVNFPLPGTWYVYIRNFAVDPTNDLVHGGIDGKCDFSISLSK